MKNIMIYIILCISTFAYAQQKEMQIQRNKKVIKKEPITTKGIFKPKDHCKGKIIITGNTVEGVVYDCSKTPYETRIIITDVLSGKVWQNTGLTSSSVPTISKLPYGRTYHASVKSRFQQYNPIWISEYGTDFTLPHEVNGTINLQNGKNEFCGNESIIVNTSVSNEVEHVWRFYKNNSLIKTLPVGNALSSIEDLQYLYNDWQPGYYFPPGNYRVDLSAENAASSKLFTINFRVKAPLGIKPQGTIIGKPGVIENHPIGNVSISTICNNRNNDGPVLKINRTTNLNNCDFIDETVTVSVQELNLVNGNHQNPIIRNISSNGLYTLKLKNHFPPGTFTSNKYYLINSKVVKLLSFNDSDCNKTVNKSMRKKPRINRVQF